LSTDRRAWRRPLGWDDFQNHPEWHAHDAIQLLFPNRVRGRLLSRGGAGPGHRRGLVRDDVAGRGRRRWDGLQNHPERHADDAIQLLLPTKVRGRRKPLRWAGPGHPTGRLKRLKSHESRLIAKPCLRNAGRRLRLREADIGPVEIRHQIQEDHRRHDAPGDFAPRHGGTGSIEGHRGAPRKYHNYAGVK